MLRRLGLGLWVAIALVIGCGSVAATKGENGGTDGAASGTGGAGGAASGTGGAGGGAGAGAVGGTSGSAGAAGGVGGTGGAQPTCYNGLTITGNFVMATAGGQGTAQGGVIADGIYDLISSYYAGPAVSDVPFQSVTIRVTGNTMDMVSMLRTDTAPTYRSYTFAVQGSTMLTSTVICGPTRGVRGYTATTTTLQLMSSNIIGTANWNSVETYTKR